MKNSTWNRLRSLRSLTLGAFFLFAGSAHAVMGTTIQLGLEGPFTDSPGINAPPATASALSSFGNFFVDLFERFGLYAAVYPLQAGSLHVGLSADAMWHYDMDTGRDPIVVGYNHVGLAPAVTLDLAPGLFAHAAFGLNRMGSRYGDSNDFGVGTLVELSAGLGLGALTIEGVFQNRSGLFNAQYGLLRLALGF